jgi:hypothetical protein
VGPQNNVDKMVRAETFRLLEIEPQLSRAYSSYKPSHHDYFNNNTYLLTYGAEAS